MMKVVIVVIVTQQHQAKKNEEIKKEKESKKKNIVIIVENHLNIVQAVNDVVLHLLVITKIMINQKKCLKKKKYRILKQQLKQK